MLFRSLVARKDERTEVDVVNPDPFLQEMDRPVERAFFTPGETGRGGYETDFLDLVTVHLETNWV